MQIYVEINYLQVIHTLASQRHLHENYFERCLQGIPGMDEKGKNHLFSLIFCKSKYREENQEKLKELFANVCSMTETESFY